MSCTLCTKRGSPCICSSTTTDPCDACRQAHKKCLFIVHPFRPRGQRSSHPRRPCKDSFVVDDDETISEHAWTPGTRAGQQERFRMISPVPSSINLSTRLPAHHPMVTSLLDLSEVITRPMKDGDGKRKLELGPILTMSCNQWDSNSKVSCLSPPYLIALHAIILTFTITHRMKPPKSPRQDSPVASLPCEQTPRQPTPGPSGTRCPSSQPHEDDTTREPEPVGAPMQSTEEPFGKSPLLFLQSSQLFLTFSSAISSLPCHSPLHNYHRQYAHWIPPLQCPREPQRLLPPVQSPSTSHVEARQEFTDLRPTLMIPQAIVHKSINQILLEHRRLLHMIPFVDATHRN
ncbi:hypothetical protein O181_050043 [Austropuccinia psidii MF-1]|uniref:Zn(2)-C6 fungal-type domain-containing protein n=1 Tax=Austropuccinia psidii MF-1 TaxID=1389203 RepID=A0A9Q3E110_9BASI|nr:hypothetical protein [Austropuccinia psidii MF-1]